jgi:hypothetical protein
MSSAVPVRSGSVRGLVNLTLLTGAVSQRRLSSPAPLWFRGYAGIYVGISCAGAHMGPCEPALPMGLCYGTVPL